MPPCKKNLDHLLKMYLIFNLIIIKETVIQLNQFLQRPAIIIFYKFVIESIRDML